MLPTLDPAWAAIISAASTGMIGIIIAAVSGWKDLRLFREQSKQEDARSAERTRADELARLREVYVSALHGLTVVGCEGPSDVKWGEDPSRSECLKWLTRLVLDFPPGHPELRDGFGTL